MGCLAAIGLWVALGAASATARTVYVANLNSGNVTPIETDTNMAEASFPTGVIPNAVAVTPDGATAYVLDAGNIVEEGPGLVPIATATNTAGTKIPINIPPIPISLAISPDGDTAYIGANTDMGAGRVFPFDLGAGTVGTPIPAGAAVVTGIAVTPDGDTVFAVSADGTVTPIIAETNTPGTPIPVGTNPSGIAITPDGDTAYVANIGTDNVTPIDLTTNPPTPETAIPAGDGPNGIAITPDGDSAYVANLFSDSVTPIDTASNTADTAITVGDQPRGIAITPDGDTAYVANRGSDSVTPIDTATNTTGTAITVGDFPEGVAIVPDQGPVAAFTSTPAPAGQASGFDGSGSSDPDGTVASFDWGFGDGNLLADGGPTASHVYTQPGAYTATLTVTDDEGCSTDLVFTGQTAYCNASPLAQFSDQLSVPALPPPPTCAGKQATIVGTLEQDALRGTEGRDVIAGLGGDDVIRSLGGNDLFCGGSGNDRLLGGKGEDHLIGQDGDDNLMGGRGQDRIGGGAGDDRILTTGRFVDSVDCGAGEDRVTANPGDRIATDCEQVRRKRG